MTEYDQAVGQLRLISAAIDQGELDGARTPLVFATVAVNAMQAEIARLRKIEAAACDARALVFRAKQLVGTPGRRDEGAQWLGDAINRIDAAFAPSSTEPILNEYGFAACICGTTVLPENWANHLRSRQRGPHRAPQGASDD